MNENQLSIKEKRSGYITKGLVWLLIMIVSLLVALLPYLLSSFGSADTYFYIAGGIAFVASTTLFVIHLFKECNPGNALVLTETGFTNKKNTGDLEISWKNVLTVKNVGKSDNPFLGIVLENSDIVIDNLKEKYADVMRDNLEENLPAILIEQNDIRIPLSELKDILTKYVREARNVVNEAPQKPKNNPFSTEDVLRAFGKIPQEVTTEEPSTETIENNDSAVSGNILDDIETDIQQEETPEQENDNQQTLGNDSFYEALKGISIVPEITDEEEHTETEDVIPQIDETPQESFEDTIPELDDLLFVNIPQQPKTEEAPESLDSENEEKGAQDDTVSEDNELSEEINQLLSRSKSTKIAEIEKILNEKEVPYSYARTENNPEVKSTPAESVENEPEPTKPQDEFDDLTAKMGLDALFQNVTKEKETKKDEASSKKDSLEENFYPDLILLNENDKKKSSASDDDMEFIIPDIE